MITECLSLIIQSVSVLLPSGCSAKVAGTTLNPMAWDSLFYCSKNNSQNCKMVEVGKGFSFHLVQTLLKQGHPEQTCWLLKVCLSRMETQKLLLTLRVKKRFLMLRQNLLCISLCWLPLVLSPGTTEKSLSLSSLYPPWLYLYTLIRTLWAFSSPDWMAPALSNNRCINPLVTSEPLFWTLSSSSISLLCLGTQNWTQHSGCSLAS